jgi:hypothetical protein
VWGAPGWVAFLTTDGLRYGADLPVRPSPLAAWRDGPVISPYLRALKQQRAVIVAIVDSRSAHLYRYAAAELTARPDLALAAEDESGLVPSTERGMPAPAPRRALDPEHTQRRRLATFQRLATSLAARLTELAGDDAWILIGGAPRWAQLASEGLPASLASRTMVSKTLDHDAPPTAIARAARRAATALRAAHGRALVHRLIERSGAGGRGAAGIPAVQRALRARAVDLLMVSPEFIRVFGREAEDAVRAALAQGADIEVLSGDAAVQLDQHAEGLAARLRYAIDGPATSRIASTGGGNGPRRPHLPNGGNDAA